MELNSNLNISQPIANLENLGNSKNKILDMVTSPKNIFAREENYKIKNKLLYHLNLVTVSKRDIDKNIVFMIAELIKFIDNYGIKGSEKKEIITKVLDAFLTEKKYNNREYIINNVCPEIIDILILVDRRKIVLTRKRGCCFF